MPLVALLAALLLFVGPALGEDRLLGASASDHMWIVLPPRQLDRGGTAAAGPPGAWRLLHLHPGMAAGVRVALTIESAPVALAAAGDRVWIVFPSAPGDDRAGEVWTLRAAHNAALDTWFNEPLDRLELQPALPREGLLEAFAADDEGPMAVLLAEGGSRSLVRLRGDAWLADQPSPPDIEAAGVLDAGNLAAALDLHVPGLVSTGSRRSTLVLVDPGPTPLVWTRRPREPWIRMSERLPGAAVALAATSELAIAALDAQGDLLLMALRGDRPLRLGRIPAPAGDWCLLGAPDGLRLVSASSEDGSLEVHRIDPRRPERMTRVELAAPRSERARWVHIPLLGGLALGVAMLLLLVRSDRIGAGVPVPPGLAPAELPQRAMGAIVDYVPAAFLVWLVTGCPALDLLTLPIWTMPIDRAGPPLGALLLSVLVAGATEAIWGTSLGKRLVGARVLAAAGGRPAAWRSLLRALLKFIVLSLPVLGVFHLLNPQKRGLPELLTGTFVLRQAGDAGQG